MFFFFKTIAVVGLLLFAIQVSEASETGPIAVYSDSFQGRTTASGEVYNRNALTAAHPTLAFGTLVRVANFETGRMVDVRINDRKGLDGRLLNLSGAAAEKIGLDRRATAPGSILTIGEARRPQQQNLAPATVPYSAPVAGSRASGLIPNPGSNPATAGQRSFRPFANASNTRQSPPSRPRGLFGKEKPVQYGIPAHSYQPPKTPRSGLFGRNRTFQPVATTPSQQPIANATVPFSVNRGPSGVQSTTGSRIPNPESMASQRTIAPAARVPSANAVAAPVVVQFGAFRNTANAQQLAATLSKRGISTAIRQSQSGLITVVTNGGFGSSAEAQQWIDTQGQRGGWRDRPVIVR